ncbi:MAG: shikimate kinase [Marinilabiliales bacterium]|nr:MAG: shikimate kinase [Marinilabiliales bacterium]
MGSGKSTTGRILAGKLGYTFADLDKLVEEKEGMPVTEIFARRGEDYFRRAEADMLETIVDKSDMVIACGGGTPCFHDNMSKMKRSGITVYLSVPPALLAKRLSDGKQKRPLIAGMKGAELRDHIRRLLAGREGWYRQSDIIFNSADEGVNELIELLKPHLGRRN